MTKVAQEVLQQLDGKLRQQSVLAFQDIQAALLASDTMENEISSLEDFEPSSTSGVLIVVGVPPSSQQVFLEF